MFLQFRWGVTEASSRSKSRLGGGALPTGERKKRVRPLFRNARNLLLILGALLALGSCKATVAGGEGNTLVAGAPLLGIPGGQGTNGCIDPVAGTSVVNARTFLASGGTPPPGGYTWSVSAGSVLPPGTTMDSQTGIFRGNGVSVEVGVYNFSMDVTDGSTTASAPFFFNVDTAASEGGTCKAGVFEQIPQPTDQLPPAAVKGSYGASLFVVVGGGGSAAALPLSWSLGSGTLPPGMTIDSVSGIVRGNPPVSASGQSYSFTITVTDQNGKVAACPSGGVCPSYFLSAF